MAGAAVMLLVGSNSLHSCTELLVILFSALSFLILLFR